MDQQRLKAYLDLIQGLLSCASGEEWILLRQHEDLVNLELVQVMEQVASHLAAENNLKAAKFLHNWAGQLHHILTETVRPTHDEDKSQAYLKLIQALLNCPQGSEAEILAANQELIGPGLVQAMKQVANQMLAEGDLETANFLNNLAADLNRTWLQAHEFKPILKNKSEEEKISPDPWQEDRASQEQPSTTSSQPVTTSRQLDTENNHQIVDLLATIAKSLGKLETILTDRFHSSDPLWYMNILERAYASNWILTTEEVEQLIGVKPNCQKGQNYYQRGVWLFVKTGKIGSQTAWQVKKNTKEFASDEKL